MNPDKVKDFLERLLAKIEQPVVLIEDTLQGHHANCLKEWFRR